MRWLVLSATVLAAAAGPAAAEKPVDNRPYVQSGADGAFYARCIPDDAAGSAGRTEIYRVGKQKDDLVCTYDWYPAHGLTLAWSPAAGKIAVMARRSGPTTELSFHLGPTRLADYSTADLGKLGVDVGPRRSATGPVSRAEFRILGCEQVPGTNDYLFVIESKGKRLAFDIVTGKPRVETRGEQ
jgi:hypothetical protein